jgi:Ca-activated chloride channel family protein
VVYWPSVSFQWPFLSWAVLLVLPALVAYALFERRRRTSAREFTTPAMLPNVAPVPPRWRRYAPIGFYMAALACLLVALARPQTALSVPRERATVLLVMDASRSMLATDIAPTRLEVAQRAAAAFLDRLPRRYQVGIVSFAGAARVLNHPTTDRVAARRALGAMVTRWGTAIGDGLDRALDSRPQAREQSDDARVPTVILLLSDGNNTKGLDPLEVAARARREQVRVYTVALGTGRPSRAAGAGRVIRPANERVLRSIAETTGGRFFSAPTEDRLTTVYRNLGSSIGMVREQQEVTYAFVGAAIALLVAGGASSLAWFNRFP